MIRLIIILLTITAISLGLAWVADVLGHISAEWGDYRLDASPLVVLAGVAVIAAICMAFYWLFFLLLRGPRIWSRARLAKRQSLGLQALTETFAAIATQDMVAAHKQIKRAQHLLPGQPLTLMFAAQVARLEGNDSQARLYLEQMSKAEGTQFLAMRGLIENARRAGDDQGALAYAEKALALKPQNPWLITTLVGLYSRLERAQNALQLLEQSARKRYITKQEARTLSAYTLYENALLLTARNRDDFAIAVLEDVLRKLPGFAPAAASLSDLYVKQGETKRALKVIGAAWKIAPHPALTDAMVRCYDGGLELKKISANADRMAQEHPEHRESLFLTARMALKKQEFATARRSLIFLLDKSETSRVCALMAEIEDAAQDHEQAAHWLKRGANATLEPAWNCSHCHQTSDLWHLTCSHCGNVASYAWK